MLLAEILDPHNEEVKSHVGQAVQCSVLVYITQK